jgi:citrate synthase
MRRKHLEVQCRNEDFAERTATRIWYEKPTNYNPYLADKLISMPGCYKVLCWGQEFARALEPNKQGWLYTGVAAATFCDLDFQPRAATGLLQLICSPGLLAHGIEMANKPTTAMPRVDDHHYVIER